MMEHLARSCCVFVLLAAAGSAQGEAKLPGAPRVIWHVDAATFHAEVPILGDVFYSGGKSLTGHRIHSGEEVHRADKPGPWLSPSTSSGLVFVRHHDGTLHCFASDLTRELWQLPLEHSWMVGTALGDMYFVTSGSEVLAITAGEIQWRTDLGSEVAMQPATDGRRVFVASAEGVVLALAIHDGEEFWRHESAAEYGYSPPVVDDGILFLADRGVRDGRRGALNAFDVDTGERLWSEVFSATGFSRPFAHGDRVWAGFGRKVASFDRVTGVLDRAGAIKTGANAFGRPAVVADRIAFGNLDGNFYVHDLATGELRWRFEVGTGKRDQVNYWALHDGVLIVGTTRGVYGIGETVGEAPAPAGFVLKPPAR